MPRGRSLWRAGCAVALVGLLLGLLTTASLAGPAQAGTPFTFTVAGDYGANANTTAVLNGIAAVNPAFHVAIGDFSYSEVAPESAWCDYVKSKVGPTFPFELLAGNHEDDGP